MPRERKFAQSVVGQIAQTEARHEALEIAPVQHIEFAKRDPPGANFLHPGLVFTAPGVRKGKPVEVVSKGSEDPLRLASHRGAPVDERPEHVKKHRPNGGHERPPGVILGPGNAPVRQPKIMAKSLIKWRERRDSNPRPLP